MNTRKRTLKFDEFLNEEVDNIDRCYDCGSTELDPNEETGELTCRQCGAVNALRGTRVVTKKDGNIKYHFPTKEMEPGYRRTKTEGSPWVGGGDPRLNGRTVQREDRPNLPKHDEVNF